MVNINWNELMNMIEEERQKELACANASFGLMKKTLNPIARFRHWSSYNMFMNHVRGIDIVTNKLIYLYHREMGVS